eukprot:Seg4521.1 transcript_id=Seg4521.1/GoldUCD/mRNA.D3Y31 product="Retinol dehydrogenase 8" protein_id=Seg4521.1/GoldUCD/D3Y31
MAESSQKIVLITGCSTGIGLATAILLAKDNDRRFKVYATMRNLAKTEMLENAAGKLLNHTLIIKQLDVISDEQINDVVDEISSQEGKIDILVNNAGVGMFGAIEAQSMDKIRSMFATNVYGPINLTQKLVPIWKKQKSGHLIMVSSIGGVVALPFNSTYCASKFAIEGFSEALAAECVQFGIKVSLIEPGPVLTSFVENVKNSNAPSAQDLAKVDNETQELIKTFMEKSVARFSTMGQSAEQVAECILEAINSPQPNLRYQTNKLYSTAIQQKLTDPTGNGVLEYVKKNM